MYYQIISQLYEPYPASVFLVQPAATHHELYEPLAHPLCSRMPTIQYLSTNPRFPPFNLLPGMCYPVTTK